MGNCWVKKNNKYNDDSKEPNPEKEQQPLPKSAKVQKPPRKPRSHFICSDKKNETIVKEPGSLNGDQFKIEQCIGCTIYILDHTTTVFVDDCVDCNIFIGPCNASAFIRDCKSCNMVIACQQYRSRDCENIKTLLYCQSQPVIETSKNMQFGCFFFAYPQLNQQFINCKLLRWSNHWSDIFDFTPGAPGSVKNYSYIEDKQIMPDVSEAFPALQCTSEFSKDVTNLPVPFTLGMKGKYSSDSTVQRALIMILPNVSTDPSLIQKFNTNKKITMIRTNQLKLSEDSRTDFIFEPNELADLKKRIDLSIDVVCIQLESKNSFAAISSILPDSESFLQWNSNHEKYSVLNKLIFENWEDERK